VNKPLYITTPTHVVALWSYITSAVIAGCFATGLLDRASWLHLLRFPPLVSLVTIGWCFAAITGWIASVAASRVTGHGAAIRIRWWMLVEAGACAMISGSIAIYLVAIFSYRGFAVAGVTTLLLAGKMFGPAHRIRQIWRERPLLQRAAASSQTAEVLADPSADDETQLP